MDQPYEWNFSNRFRLLFTVYFLFLIFDFTSSDELFPHFVYVAMRYYTNFWNWIVPWTGEHILKLSYPITVTPNGSGDTTFNYVLQLLWLIFAIGIAATCAFLNTKRPSYNQLRYWSRIVIRYYLAYMLFVYGFVKIIKLQFPFPSLVRLTETYGDSSPMGLAWTFIGYSSGYNIYIGGAEVLAGVLLFFKRTTLLGALVAITVMGNVFAMNLAYDIPVKVFSLNLLFMAVWIAWYDKDRLLAFFITHQPVLPKSQQYLFNKRWKKLIQIGLKCIAIGFALYSTLWSSWNASKSYGDMAPKPALYGIYDVEQFFVDEKEIPPLTTDSTRWKRMIVNYPNNVRLTVMTETHIWKRMATDTIAKTIKFTSYDDSTKVIHFRYQKPDKEHLLLNGIIDSSRVVIKMKRFDEKKFTLVRTGFNWINEYPNNQ